jgi:leucyl aminopeptidase
MDFQFKSISVEKEHIGIAFCDSKLRLLGYAKKLDQLSKKHISSQLKSDLSFQNRKSKQFDYCVIHNPNNLKLSKLYIFKLKDYNNYSIRDFQILGGHLRSLISFYQEDKVGIYPDGVISKKVSFINGISEMLIGSLLAGYKFNKYKKINNKDNKIKKTSRVKIYSSSYSRLEKNYINVEAVSEGTALTRNLVTEPPNVMTPPEIAKNAESLEKFGIKVTVLGEKEMAKLGMGSLLSVGRASEHESKLAIMEWKGHKNKKKKPIAFIGKGVSFDTGGVSLKPSGGMEEMKYDMGGSGVVIGLMKTLALRKAKVNAIGVVGLVENHIGNMAYTT